MILAIVGRHKGQGRAIMDHGEECDFQQTFFFPNPYELYEKSSKLCAAGYLQKRSSFLQEMLICDQQRYKGLFQNV